LHKKYVYTKRSTSQQTGNKIIDGWCGGREVEKPEKNGDEGNCRGSGLQEQHAFAIVDVVGT
jgi:hypothetical protein